MNYSLAQGGAGVIGQQNAVKIKFTSGPLAGSTVSVWIEAIHEAYSSDTYKDDWDANSNAGAQNA